MGQAKQRGTAQERAESAIQSTIDATLAKIKTVLDGYYQDMDQAMKLQVHTC